MREDGDDSYEAAMRAADALFARPAPQPAQRQAASSAPAGGADASVSSAGVSSTDAPPPAPDRGGRILRALDEPPSPQLVALEAAHAPKRRGRKPGSKNKPKIKPGETKPAEIEPAEVASSAVADLPPHTGRLPGGRFEDRASLAVQTSQAETTVRRIEAIPVAHAPSNGSKRFSWARDRLKPGEGWKRRRLPRICW